MARDKIITEARERFEYAKEQWGEIYKSVREDLEFSDPTNPKQWPEQVVLERQNATGGPRPCYVFDQTGQFVRQVVNTARRNKPAMKFLPVDNESDPELAEVLQGLARQTEYESRADVAYIWALESATRGGLGYFRAITEPDTYSGVKDKVCVKILRVHNFEAVYPDPDFVEPDGSDMRWGFVVEDMPKATFKKKWPKAKVSDFDEGWATEKTVRIAEYFRIVETSANVLTVNGQEMGEDEYWEASKAGTVDPAIRPEASLKKSRRVEWYKISGEEILEKTEFPGEYVPIFPVFGNESWIEDKRHLGGCVRTAKDAQIAYNYERNSEIEAVAIGPKAPWIAPVEAIEGHEAKWRMANTGNQAYLPWNSIDESGNPIQKPERVTPAGIAAGWTQLSERSKADIQAALGMYQASIGNNPNEQSGRAVLALQDKADIGTFHYVDNLALSISHLGRVLTQVWPVILDAEQIVRIIGEDDEPDFVAVDPNQPQGYAKRMTPMGEQVVINPGAGRFDVRCVVGPAFSTRQTEAAAELSELVNGNPQMMAILGDVWVKMRNFPEADKIGKRLKALLPPQVKAMEDAEENEQQPMPPEAITALQAAAQEIQALQQQLQEAQSGLAGKQIDAQSKIEAARINAESQERIAAMQAQQRQQQAEMTAVLQAMAKHTESIATKPEPVKDDRSDQVLAMLAQALQGLNQPKVKKMAIKAPSGQVYEGQIVEAAGGRSEAY